MAKYQQYEEYKDSGVEWLGEIPKDWKAIKVKYIADTVSTGGTPKDLSSFTLEPEVCWFTPGDFHDGQILRQANKYVTWKSVNTNDAKIYKENSVLVIGIGATLGKVAHCSIPFSCNQQINVITPNSNISSFFLMYSLLVQDEQMSLSSNASTIGIMNQEKTKDILLALPSLKEQKTVTNFLDYQTAQIDTLIDKQQTLIQLLKEKRQAVISHAVTKGLNPDAPMKDSGVEWLGEVPEHWAVIKLANYAIPLNGDRGSNYPSGNDFVDEGVFFISTSEVVDGYVKTDTASKITLKKYNQLGGLKIKKGDIIYCLRGSVGKSGICTFDEGTISSSLMGIRSMYIDPYYLILLLTSSSELQQRLMLVTGSVSANLSAQNVMGYKFAIPEKAEQLIIIAHVKNSLERIDILLSKATQAIQLMQERRTALISAAVTGKIDVRGWRAPE